MQLIDQHCLNKDTAAQYLQCIDSLNVQPKKRKTAQIQSIANILAKSDCVIKWQRKFKLIANQLARVIEIQPARKGSIIF